MKIGIFDPGLNLMGHFLPLNRHIVKLFEDKNNEITFFDIANIFENSCKKECSFKKDNVSFINVADIPMAELFDELKTLPQRIAFFVKEFLWCKTAFKKIYESKLDFLIITSPGHFAFSFFIPKVKFVVIFHVGRQFFFKREFSPRYFMQVLRKKIILRFLRRAEVVFVLSEYLNDKMSSFNFKRIGWIPYTCFENSDGAANSEKEIKEFVISTPGAIYHGKNIDFVLDAYKKYNLSFKYIVAGIPSGDYGRKIVKIIELLGKNTPITGIFRYLSDKEYQEIIQRSSFVLLPYSEERSNGISAVMQDAFENNTPIISPDIEPFRYYVNKYKLGLLYKPDNQASLAKTIEIASRMDKKTFGKNFERFKKDFSYAESQKKLRKIISEIII